MDNNKLNSGKEDSGKKSFDSGIESSGNQDDSSGIETTENQESGIETNTGTSGSSSGSDFSSGSIYQSGAVFTDVEQMPEQGAMSIVQKGKLYGKWHIIKRIKSEFTNDDKYKPLIHPPF